MEIEVKRLDLSHPEAPGNKFFKLKYNLLKAVDRKATRLVSVGGAYSNHLHALASVCNAIPPSWNLGLPAGCKIACTGIVRGEEAPTLSPTLSDCREWGMDLHFISRVDYQEVNSQSFKEWVYEQWPGAYFIPEGGSNYLGVNGCMEMLEAPDKAFDYIAVPVGTGCTLAGLLLAADSRQRMMAFPALNDSSLPERVKETLYWTVMDRELVDTLMERVDWVWDYTFGGFAKVSPDLTAFMEEQALVDLPLDRVYTSKMLFGLHDMKRKGHLAGKTVLAMHTGGLQGNRVR